MRIRDYFYNALAGIATIALLTLLFVGVLTIGKGAHPADRCAEDDVWAAVSIGTEYANVTRACVNAEEYATAVVADMAERRGG